MKKLDHGQRVEALDVLTRTMVDAFLPTMHDVTTHSRFESNCVLIDVRAPEEAHGRLIGRNGQTIQALRVMIKAAAAKYGVRCELMISTNAAPMGGN